MRLADGDTVEGRSVVIATGARYRSLDIPRIDDLLGLGVYYAATAIEADMCSGSAVAIVGGGNSAGQAAMFLSRSVREVSILIRRPSLEATMSKYLIDQIERTPNIQVRGGTQVRELVGERSLEAVVVEADGEREELHLGALFVFIGAEPRTGWLEGEVEMDDKGFVRTGRELEGVTDAAAAPALMLETSRPGRLRGGRRARGLGQAGRLGGGGGVDGRSPRPPAPRRQLIRPPGMRTYVRALGTPRKGTGAAAEPAGNERAGSAQL